MSNPKYWTSAQPRIRETAALEVMGVHKELYALGGILLTVFMAVIIGLIPDVSCTT
jgi:hypothetical protein